MPGRPRSELLTERAKLASWISPLDRTPQFGARYCIWLIDKARAALAEQDAVIAGLKAENDQLTGRNVLLVMERHAAHAMAGSTGEADGTVLRCTDTGREWVLHGGAWLDNDQGE